MVGSRFLPPCSLPLDPCAWLSVNHKRRRTPAGTSFRTAIGFWVLDHFPIQPLDTPPQPQHILNSHDLPTALRPPRVDTAREDDGRETQKNLPALRLLLNGHLTLLVPVSQPISLVILRTRAAQDLDQPTWKCVTLHLNFAPATLLPDHEDRLVYKLRRGITG